MEFIMRKSLKLEGFICDLTLLEIQFIIMDKQLKYKGNKNIRQNRMSLDATRQFVVQVGHSQPLSPSTLRVSTAAANNLPREYSTQRMPFFKQGGAQYQPPLRHVPSPAGQQVNNNFNFYFNNEIQNAQYPPQHEVMQRRKVPLIIKEQLRFDIHQGGYRVFHIKEQHLDYLINQSAIARGQQRQISSLQTRLSELSQNLHLRLSQVQPLSPEVKRGRQQPMISNTPSVCTINPLLEERIEKPEVDSSKPLSLMQSTNPHSGKNSEEKNKTTETIETTITKQNDSPKIGSHFEQEILPFSGEKAIRVVILWASPLGYKRFENFRYSFALNLPQLSFLDFTDELKENLKQKLAERGITLDFKKQVANCETVNKTPEGEVLVITMHGLQGMPEATSSLFEYGAHIEKEWTGEKHFMAFRDMADDIKVDSYKVILIAVCDSIKLGEMLFEKNPKLHVICAQQGKQLNMKIANVFVRKYLELLASDADITYCQAFHDTLDYIDQQGLSTGNCTRKSNFYFKIMPSPNKRQKLCQGCTQKSTDCKLSPFSREKLAEKRLAFPLYITANNQTPKLQEPRYLRWVSFIGVMLSLKGKYTTVQVMPLPEMESSSFMRNLYHFNKDRDNFEYGMLYLECSGYSDVASLLFAIYQMMLLKIKQEEPKLEFYSVETLSEAFRKLFQENFPTGIFDQDNKEWSFCLFLDSIYFNQEKEKLDFVDLVNSFTKPDSPLYIQNLLIVFSSEQSFNFLHECAIERLGSFSKHDAFKFVEYDFDSFFNPICAMVRDPVFLNKVLTKENLSAFQKSTMLGSFFYEKSKDLSFWKQCTQESVDAAIRNGDETHCLIYYFTNSPLLLVTSLQEMELIQLSKLIYSTSINLVGVFKFFLDKKMDLERKQKQLTTFSIKLSAKQKYELLNQPYHIFIFWLIFSIPFKQGLTQLQIVEILRLVRFEGIESVSEEEVSRALYLLQEYNLIEAFVFGAQRSPKYRVAGNLERPPNTENFYKRQATTEYYDNSEEGVKTVSDMIDYVGKVIYEKFMKLLLQYYDQALLHEMNNIKEWSISTFFHEHEHTIKYLIKFFYRHLPDINWATSLNTDSARTQTFSFKSEVTELLKKRNYTQPPVANLKTRELTQISEKAAFEEQSISSHSISSMQKTVHKNLRKKISCESKQHHQDLLLQPTTEENFNSKILCPENGVAYLESMQVWDQEKERNTREVNSFTDAANQQRMMSTSNYGDGSPTSPVSPVADSFKECMKRLLQGLVKAQMEKDAKTISQEEPMQQIQLPVQKANLTEILGREKGKKFFETLRMNLTYHEDEQELKRSTSINQTVKLTEQEQNLRSAAELLREPENSEWEIVNYKNYERQNAITKNSGSLSNRYHQHSKLQLSHEDEIVIKYLTLQAMNNYPPVTANPELNARNKMVYRVSKKMDLTNFKSFEALKHKFQLSANSQERPVFSAHLKKIEAYYNKILGNEKEYRVNLRSLIASDNIHAAAVGLFLSYKERLTDESTLNQAGKLFDQIEYQPGQAMVANAHSSLANETPDFEWKLHPLCYGPQTSDESVAQNYNLLLNPISKSQRPSDEDKLTLLQITIPDYQPPLQLQIPTEQTSVYQRKDLTCKRSSVSRRDRYSEQHESSLESIGNEEVKVGLDLVPDKVKIIKPLESTEKKVRLNIKKDVAIRPNKNPSAMRLSMDTTSSLELNPVAIRNAPTPLLSQTKPVVKPQSRNASGRDSEKKVFKFV